MCYRTTSNCLQHTAIVVNMGDQGLLYHTIKIEKQIGYEPIYMTIVYRYRGIGVVTLRKTKMERRRLALILFLLHNKERR